MARTVKAARDWRCEGCGRRIPAGWMMVLLPQQDGRQRKEHVNCDGERAQGEPLMPEEEDKLPPGRRKRRQWGTEVEQSRWGRTPRFGKSSRGAGWDSDGKQTN